MERGRKMLAKLYSCSIQGIEACLVEVEVDITLGLPSFEIVGLPDKSVRESKERVRSALKNSGFDFPNRRITVNLAPADLKKEGPGFDLPIALGVLAATEQITQPTLTDWVVVGELSLDGKIKPVCGILAMALKCKEKSMAGLILSEENTPEAGLMTGVKIISLNSLNQVREKDLPIYGGGKGKKLNRAHPPLLIDMQDVKGQEQAKRALEVAAAGNHNILFIGPPGSGKTMLAQRLITILPPLSLEESLEVTQIYSVAGMISNRGQLVSTRPFRSPHHTISCSGLIGGGRSIKPGEITLAHHGVLFLDEVTEFRRDALEALRQPLEERKINIMRNNFSYLYPANFLLVSSCNPCPCGFRGDLLQECQCDARQVKKYFGKISGPLWDRFDIHLEVPRLGKDKLMEQKINESSLEIRGRVEKARNRQKTRLEKLNLYHNAQIGPRELKQFCYLTSESKAFLNKALDKFALSARAYDKILRLALTITDLAGEEQIKPSHLAEAIQYRTLDRNQLI